MIKLNLCGTLFEVDKKILCKSEYFLNMFTDCNDNNNIININRPAHIFKHVLAYLIDDNYLYPSKYENELKYFLINYDENKLYDPINKLKQQYELLKMEMEKNIHTTCNFEYHGGNICKNYVTSLGSNRCYEHKCGNGHTGNTGGYTHINGYGNTGSYYGNTGNYNRPTGS